MPIEIRQLIIKATVDSGNSNGGGAGNTNVSEIVKECVDQVVEILKEEKEM